MIIKTVLTLLLCLCAGLVLLPVASVFYGTLQAEPDVWQHLQSHVLPQVLPNTLWLVLAVTLFAVLFGTLLAWLTSAYAFPGRRVFVIALLLPLAMPSYILAFVYLDWIAYPSPLPTWWRAQGWGEFPLQPGYGLTVATMTLGLYPYVFLVTRQAFLAQGQRLIEAAALLGAQRRRIAWRVVLPLALPWIAGSGLLVAMETLADYATVAIFNYDTLTTAVFSTWFSLYAKAAALKLAGLLLVLVLVLAWLERRLQPHRIDHGAREGRRLRRKTLRGAQALGVILLLLAFLALSLLGPLLQLLWWSQAQWQGWSPEWTALASRSLSLALAAGLLTTLLALAVSFASRRAVLPGHGPLSRLATFGYAFPGVVLAVGLYWPLVQLDYWLSDALFVLGLPIDSVLQIGASLLLIGYAARFLAVAHKPVQAAVDRITPRHEDSAHLLGVQGLRLGRRLYWPLLSGGMGTALLLVFLDVMKEIPITLLMRPVGWETLATKIFQFTVEGQWQEAAMPALLLVLTSLVPLSWLCHKLWQEENAR